MAKDILFVEKVSERFFETKADPSLGLEQMAKK